MRTTITSQPDEIARRRPQGTKLVAPARRRAGLTGDVTPVAPGESHEVAGVRFTTVPAYNTAEEALQFHPKANRWVGYVLELGGRAATTTPATPTTCRSSTT